MAKTYIGHGAQRVLLVDDPHLRFYRADLFTTVIRDLIEEDRPDIFLVGASDFGKELAPRIAKRIGVGLCADCVALEWDEKNQKLIASSPAFGGNYLARIAWSTHRPYMATVSAGTCAERPYEEAAHGEIVRVKRNLDKVSSNISVVSSVRDPHPTAKLEEAKLWWWPVEASRTRKGSTLSGNWACSWGARWGRPGLSSMPTGLRTNSSSDRPASRSNRNC